MNKKKSSLKQFDQTKPQLVIIVRSLMVLCQIQYDSPVPDQRWRLLLKIEIS
jgi:hypothetical protein